MMKDSPAFAAELVRRLNCFTDLHLHLDGSLSMASARELGAMQNIPVPEDDAELSGLLQVSEDCTSLTEFLEKTELVVVMVGHSEIKGQPECLKGKAVLDTRNVISAKDVYRL